MVIPEPVPDFMPVLHHMVIPAGGAPVLSRVTLHEGFGGMFPALSVARDGRIFGAFLEGMTTGPEQAEDVNSVFVTWSDDGGGSWANPRRILRAGIHPAQRTQLAIGGNGLLHLVWGRGVSRPHHPVAEVLYHAYSEDGECWSEPSRITAAPSGALEDPILLPDAGGGLHLFYFRMAELVGRPFSVMYAYWDGLLWSEPEPLFPSLRAEQGFGVDRDGSGRFHLLFRASSEAPGQEDEEPTTDLWYATTLPPPP